MSEFNIDTLVDDLNEVIEKHNVYLDIEPYADDNFIFVTNKDDHGKSTTAQNIGTLICRDDFGALR